MEAGSTTVHVLMDMPGAPQVGTRTSTSTSTSTSTARIMGTGISTLYLIPARCLYYGRFKKGYRIQASVPCTQYYGQVKKRP